MLSMAAGTFQARWASLPVFWRAQIAGWTLFAVVDLLNRQLAYGDFAVSLALTLTVTICLATMSSVMGAVYASGAINNRLTQRALVLIASLSLTSASIVALILFTLRQMLGWTIAHWGPVEEIVIPLIHYSLALMGWSFCYFWITAAVAEQAQRPMPCALRRTPCALNSRSCAYSSIRIFCSMRSPAWRRRSLNIPPPRSTCCAT